MRVCHEVDEFGGQMLGGAGRWLGAVLLLPVGEGRGGGEMVLHMAMEDRQGQGC